MGTLIQFPGFAGIVVGVLMVPALWWIIWGVCFLPSIELDYEAFRHGTAKYTRFNYAKNQALGFSCLICFALGYAWLIFIVTRQH
jgi:hypothetical protein